MGTLADKIRYLLGTKNAIKEAIQNKGVGVSDSDTFRSYADKIGSISTGTTPKMQSKSTTITSNGTRTISPDSGYDGLSKVSVTTNVSPKTQTKAVAITSNGTTTIDKDSSYDGMTRVTVTTNVPASSPTLQTKTVNVTENGTQTVNADSGYDGLASVIMNIAVASGGSSSKVAVGTFSASSASASVAVTFDKRLDAVPSIILFWESNNSTSRGTYRTKMAIGGLDPLLSGSSSTYFYQYAFYGATSVSTGYVTSAAYNIANSYTGTTSNSYPCIRMASATGFTAYQLYYSSRACPLLGTYNYIAICL